MPEYTQENRPLSITTPLGKDVVLLTGLRGYEAISQLFRFDVELLAEKATEVQFDRILGQNVTVEMRLRNGDKRYFNALVKGFSEGAQDETFTQFRAQLVPKLWLLTKKVRSFIFQRLSVPDILYQVLAGLDVTYEILGTYYPRDYCVQYRESDYDFVSRLMQEEGIFYFFKHTEGNHQMVVTDVPSKHPAVPSASNIVFETVLGEVRPETRITEWEKTQELRSGKYTLWDHCFELPGNHLEAKQKTIDSLPVGKVTHKLNVGGNDQLEIYDYPGGYAQRFDGVDRGGADRPQDIQNIFADRTRIIRVRMEQEEAGSLEIRGAGDCGQFTAGHKFSLERHFDGDGEYLLTRVEHDASAADYRSSEQTPEFRYGNRFTCVPNALHYRPQRETPKPVIAGMQTATVVGPQGEEIFVDKYGRVKVQFHWDREGKKDASSSCWLRVAQVWAGKGWGAFFWPRVGHEVVVIFEEGDPDQPLVIGSVYNAENMPGFSLPINKQLGGFKSASECGVAQKNYNGIVLNDEKGHEHLSIHSEHNLSLNSEADKMIHAGRHKGERVAVANMLTVGKFIPSGGGSGGGFDEGNPMPSPRPTGVVGINSVFTFGDNLQASCPFNHQLAIGNNLQMCINPFGLAAGVPGSSVPELLQAISGSGMGGSMQFTVGANAQFTLGQSFEVSIGPPKIELHVPYKGHPLVIGLCGALSVFSIVFMIAYDVLQGKDNSKAYENAADAPHRDALRAEEQSGDKERVALVLAYQLFTDAALIALVAAEALTDNLEWLADETLKKLYDVDSECLDTHGLASVGPDEDDEPWAVGGLVEFGGGVAALAAIGVALELAGNE